MLNKTDKIVITGAAGLVGQNLIILLKEKGYTNLVAIDKHEANAQILQMLHPDVTFVLADLADQGVWAKSFEGAKMLIQLHAQITGKTADLFIRNNLTATANVLAAAKTYQVPEIVHVSSSVVISRTGDNYSNTKKEQEKMVLESGIPCTALRPTLMFGWFDRKHLGWLSRFMEKLPFFPVPDLGRYMRQPLYVRNFCAVIIAAMERSKKNEVFNIVGREKVNYIDIIRTIKKIKHLKIVFIYLPYWLFYFLLKVYALFSKNPPFTADQLRALCAGDDFPLTDWWSEFGVTVTPFVTAMEETITDERYNQYILER